MVADQANDAWVLGDDDAKPLPRGRHALSRETVLASQRGRMLHASLVVTAEKGFSYVSVADLVAEAGVSRKAFYQHFTDFEDCWFQAYTTAIDVTFAEMLRAVAQLPDQGNREIVLRASVDASYRLAVANPAVSHAVHIDVLGAGPRGIEANQKTVLHWANMLLLSWHGESASDASEEHKLAALAAVAILTGFARDYVAGGRASELPKISDRISDLMIRVLAE